MKTQIIYTVVIVIDTEDKMDVLSYPFSTYKKACEYAKRAAKSYCDKDSSLKVHLPSDYMQKNGDVWYNAYVANEDESETYSISIDAQFVDETCYETAMDSLRHKIIEKHKEFVNRQLDLPTHIACKGYWNDEPDKETTIVFGFGIEPDDDGNTSTLYRHNFSDVIDIVLRGKGDFTLDISTLVFTV